MVLAGEKGQRSLAKQLTEESVTSEAAPMSFPLKGGGEEIRGAALACCPDLIQKVIQLLEQNKEKLATIKIV